MESLEVLLAVALIPPIILLFFIWKVDKLEREPLRILLIVTALGAASGILALVLEIAVDQPIQAAFNDNFPLWMVVDNFIGVALMEEFSKMLVIFLVVWRHNEFNCRFDGVVYGAASALGFAALENVKYTLSYGLGTGLVRAVTAIPGHFIFGVFMGAMIGIAKCAKYDGKTGKKVLFLILALVVPTIIHGYYDYLLTVQEYGVADTELLWIGLLVAIYVSAIIMITVMAKHDRLIDKTKGVNGEALPAATAASPADALAAALGIPTAATAAAGAQPVSMPGVGQASGYQMPFAQTYQQPYQQPTYPQTGSYTAPKTPIDQPRQ